MSGASGVELLSIIRSSLDPSGYVAGAQKVQQANAQIVQSGEKVVAGQEKITRGMEQAARGAATVIQRHDAVARAFVQMTEEQAKLDRALRLGLITQDQHAKTMMAIEKQYRSVTTSANQTANAFGVTARQAQQLAPQINDVVTSLLGGASAFQVLTQQGGQVTQAMGGVGNTFRAIAGLFTPMRVGIAAVAGGLIATFAAYEGTERRLATLRNQLRGYTSDYEAMARTLERSARSQSELMPGVASADVRTAQGRLAQVVRPEDRENLQAYTALALDLSRTLDKDLSSALERVARVIHRPAEEARNLAEQGVRGFDERFRRHIELLELAGNRGQASAEVFARLNGVFGGATRDMPLMERALGNVEKAFESLWNRITDGLTNAGRPFLEWLAQSQTNADRAVSGGLGALAGVFGGGPGASGASLGELALQRQGGATNTTPGAGNAAAAGEGYAFLRSQGWSHAAASGIVARVDAESGFNPAATHDGGRGIGILGWNGSRREALSRFASVPGESEAQRQWRFIHHELTQGSEQAAGALLRQAPTADAAGRIASRAYARPGMPGDGGAFSLQQMFRTGQMAEQYSRTLSLPAPPAPVRPSGIGSDAAATGVRELSADQRSYQSALAEARNRGTQVGERETLEARRARFQSALGQAPAGSQEYRELQQAIEGVNAALNGTERPIDQFIRGQRDAARVAGATEGHARELAQAMQGLEEAARSQGRDPTAEERAEVRRAVLERSVAGYRDLTANVERQIEAEERLAQAYAQGNAAAQETEARNRAMEDARRLNIAGTEQEAIVVADLTQKYLRLNAAQNGRAIAARLPDQQQQVELLRQQNATIGMSQSDQALALARINATAYVNRDAAGTSETAGGQAYIANAVEIARLQEQARTLKEMEGYGREVAGVLVDGFQAVAFQGRSVTDTLKSMEQALLQLGTRALILKPLEDALGRLSSMAFGGGGGAGGGMGGGLGGLLGSIFGGGGAGLAAEGGGSLAAAGADLFVKSAVLHGGGVVGNDNVPQRIVPSALFRAAPRFHTGGGLLSRSEFPAILEYGERVLTKRQQAAVGAAVSGGGGRPVVINQTIQTADPGSFNRSRSQIAMATRRDIARASRNA